MKKILAATALLAALSFAATDTAKVVKPVFAKPDSAKKHEIKRDSLKLPVLPDSLKAKLEAAKKEHEAKRAEMATKDSIKRAEHKLAADSLRKIWEAKRDSQVAKIKNDTARAKVEARIQKIAEHKAEVKAKVEAKKEKIEAKKAAKPAAPAKPEAPVAK